MGDDELLDAEADVAACRRAQARAEVLHAQLAAEQQTVQALRRRLDDERDDVRKLGGGFSSLMARLRGRRDDLLQSERAELAAAEAELAAHTSAMRRLSARFAEARDDATRLPDAETRLASVVERREQEIAASGDARAAALRDLDEELAYARGVRDEIQGARHAALGAIGALEHAVGKLTVAEGWSVVDLVSDRSGGVRHGSMRYAGDWAGRAKHDQLDEAVVPIAEAHAALLQLRAELTDVSAGTVHRPNVRMPSTGLGTLDIWFDNTFSDLMVHDRITSSISELQRAIDGVNELLSELEPRRTTADELVARLEADRAELLRGG